MKSLIFPALLVLMIMAGSCKSPLSDGKVEDLSAICAKINVQQNLSDRKDNSVTVSLYDDDDYTIDNKNIIIKVNGMVLDTVGTRIMYYTKSIIYFKEDVPVNNEYKFEIILTDKKTHVLGSIKPIEESNENTISLPEKGNFDQDLLISWHKLKEINELSISKSMLLKTSNKLETNYAYESTIVKIGAEGNYSFPKSSFINSKAILNGIEMKFTAQKYGKMNKQLLPKSEIKISGHIDKYVDFDEEKKMAK
ncbi:hypothetical protein LPB86_11590 [Pedobacter sp. MC2016-14]|uniref:hypothetical protein n=1 Tax=Pedobacter sp. MC2016-14 TaxID=2897327 RepID=UPI001E4E43B9|nr:hypothetical protein [Pedobacter sp. MC2016-14]MCD0488876.1 hypothetical protein [Pedobacter sp. MC2016-14]